MREETDKVDFVGGQTAAGETGDESAGAGNGFDAATGGEGGADDSLAGIADAGCASIRNERNFLALLEAIDDFLAAFGFIEFEVAEERLFDFEMLEELAGVACVFGGDDIAFAKGAESAEGDVLEVADGGRHEIERSCGKRGQVLLHFLTHG